MRISLFKDFEGAQYYGDIPEVDGLPESQVQTTYCDFEGDLHDLIDFALKVDDACGVHLDVDDVDFFDARQCEELIRFLSSIAPFKNESIAIFAVSLKNAAIRASELGTGIVVELSL